MTGAERVRAALDERGIEYETHEHPRAVTAQQVAAAEHRSGWEVAKPVFLWSGGEMVMMVMPAPLDVDLARAAAALGVPQVRLATEPEFTERFPDCEPGAEAPFGNLYDTPVYVDARLLEEARVTFALGSHDRSATIAVEDYLAVAQPTQVEVGVQPVAG